MAIVGMKQNPKALVKNFFGCSIPLQMKFHGIPCFTPKFTKSFGGVYSDDFHTPFILR
ncbi:MAG: hypothetical protein HY806_06765 [Nitrospirae bacterium]|nr:hypothetical protein [Nitrospirota bacterium]